MLELAQRPLCRRVAARAVGSKKTNMLILRRMTRSTVKRHLERSQLRVARSRPGTLRVSVHPLHQLRGRSRARCSRSVLEAT